MKNLFLSKSRTFCFCSLFITICIYSNNIKAQTNTITACVIDAETHLPIDLIAVVSSVDYTITNNDGEFQIKSNLPDTIEFSHISYQTKRITIDNLTDTIILQPKVYQLGEVYVIPRNILIKELQAVRNKYDKLLKKKKEKDFPIQSFYYRQLTKTDNIYTEYIEAIFSAPTGVCVKNMYLQNGRYAKAKNDILFHFDNYFYYSHMSPYQSSKAKNNTFNSFLIKDFEKYYDVRVIQILSPKGNDEIRVYKFTPFKEKDGKKIFLSGNLYIRTNDKAIIRMEVNFNLSNNEGIKSNNGNIFDNKNHIIVTYKDGIESYPIVETVRCNSIINGEGIENHKKFITEINSTLFSFECNFENKGKKIKQKKDLLKTIATSNYNQNFWNENPVIKRTKIEKQVLDDFNRLGYFGSMEINQ